MNKKQFLELLIKSYGLIPEDVEHYRTDGCDGQYQISVGWSGRGVTDNGSTIIEFCEPDGFNMAVKEILRQAKDRRLGIYYVSS
ncbi:MAG TPA: hypothetical protein DCL77_14605 [Prolixibacteraceae bacterium]|jgi:hypothetical protein|nr:hypothetical protein [Prolixibacteraceae bacterium]